MRDLTRDERRIATACYMQGLRDGVGTCVAVTVVAVLLIWWLA